MEMIEQQRALLAEAGTSYDVDLSRAYRLELQGTLCFVGLKVGLARFDSFSRPRNRA